MTVPQPCYVQWRTAKECQVLQLLSILNHEQVQEHFSTSDQLFRVSLRPSTELTMEARVVRNVEIHLSLDGGGKHRIRAHDGGQMLPDCRR